MKTMTKVIRRINDRKSIFRDSNKMILIGLIDAFSSQILMQLFHQGFAVSIAVAILPVYYFFDRKLNPMIVSLYIGTIGLIFRTFTMYGYYGSLAGAFWGDFNFLYFDLAYGFLFYHIYTNKIHESKVSNNISLWMSTAVFCDFTGNTIEYISRFGVTEYVSTSAIGTFLLVAVVRVIVSVLIVTVIRYYRMLLKRQEHESRYQELILLSSNLKSEIYYMRNNMEYIEHVMNDAFYLYDNMNDEAIAVKKDLALNIAKDVHEIKKNYNRVIQGMEAIAGENKEYDKIKISELASILQNNFRKTMLNEEQNIDLSFHVRSNEYISKHYYLMSVLRNIVNNSIEAINNAEGRGVVTLIHRDMDDDHLFIIRDNGPGIKEKDLKFIFDPGFSTKFNIDTGSISRGVGLTLVKEIVEKQFLGELEVESDFGVGTTFKITIPKSSIFAG